MATPATYVLEFDHGTWTKFRGLDIKECCNLAGGNNPKNYNLFLASDLEIHAYPQDVGLVGYTDEDAYIEKEIEGFYDDYASIEVAYEGDAEMNAEVSDPRSDVAKVTTGVVLTPYKEKNFPLGFMGTKLTVRLIGMTIFDYAILRFIPMGERS